MLSPDLRRLPNGLGLLLAVLAAIALRAETLVRGCATNSPSAEPAKSWESGLIAGSRARVFRWSPAESPRNMPQGPLEMSSLLSADSARHRGPYALGAMTTTTLVEMLNHAPDALIVVE